MSRRRNAPLAENQLRRFSPASVGMGIIVWRRLGAEAASVWWLATAVGSTIAPDGSLRPLGQGEIPFVRGVLMSFDQREQLRQHLGVSPRAFQRYLAAWKAKGLAHRCTRAAEMVLLLDPRHLPGDACPWKDCPESKRDREDAEALDREDERLAATLPASPHDAVSVTSRRSVWDAESDGAPPASHLREPEPRQRHAVTLAAGSSKGEGRVRNSASSNAEEAAAFARAQRILVAASKERSA